MLDAAVRPFIKWAGGKSQLIPAIRRKYPQKITRYCEPFVGGGAVLLDVLANFRPEQVLVNDINAELVNTYRQVKTNPRALIDNLERMQAQYWESGQDRRKEIYLARRKKYNELKTQVEATEETAQQKAALFIFLNRTCFNGLYRVNRQGQFNVPIGAYKKPPICDPASLTLASELLQRAEIRCGDYGACGDFIDENTFVYIDPPYRPLSSTASFTAYSENVFDDAAQIALGDFVRVISKKGAKVLLSNSDPKNMDEEDAFFDDLYSGYTIERVSAKRMINSNAGSRGTISELLISNF